MQTPQFWYSKKNSLLSFLFYPISKLIYFFGKNRFKNKQGYQGSTPIICIGNATTGGTGKTPTAILIAQIAMENNLKPAFLTRGYKGTITEFTQVHSGNNSKHTGDEALLLANHASTYICRNRIDGANKIHQLNLYDIIITDDGLQNHPDLVKNFAVLVVDNQRGFGNKYLIPAGPLREPIHTAIKKSHIIFIIANNSEPLDIPDECEKSSKPIICARKTPLTHGIELEGENVIVFSGLGNNQQFFESVKNTGANILEAIEFPDHSNYHDRIIQRLINKAQSEAALLITTEKDMIKINPKFYPFIIPFLIHLDISDDDKELLRQKIFDIVYAKKKA